MEKEIELLKTFCSTDDTRQMIYNPFTFNGRTIATNGHIGIIINEELPELKPYDKDLSRQFSKEGYFAVNDLLISDLTKEIEATPLEDEYTELEGECEECNGEGEVEWEYTSHSGSKTCWHEMMADCPICEGSGEKSEPKKTGRKIKKFQHPIKIFDKHFASGLIEMLLKACEFYDVKSAKYLSNGVYTSSGFFVLSDRVELIIIPMRVENEG